MVPVLVSVYRLGATKWSHGRWVMLIEFREPCFQISLVKIPSYNECSLRICGLQSQIKFVQGRLSAWGGIYTTVIMIEEISLGRQCGRHLNVRNSKSGEQKD